MSTFIADTAHDLRATIERAQNALSAPSSSQADIKWLPRFPEKCCNFAANLLVLALAEAGAVRLRRMLGTVQDNRGDDLATHVWVQADGFLVDITADQFGQPKVIVEQQSSWHEALHDIKPFLPQRDLPEGVSADEIARLAEVYKDTLSTLAPFR